MEECHKMLTDQVDWANPSCQGLLSIYHSPSFQMEECHKKPHKNQVGLGKSVRDEVRINVTDHCRSWSTREQMHVLSISKMKAARYPALYLNCSAKTDEGRKMCAPMT
ncbi:hypothetical protein Tco_1076176 [Tanacetum coccineum]